MTRIPVDWQKALFNLRKHKPLTRIADEIGCDEQTLNRISRGDVLEPRFTVGIAILNLHTDLVGADKTQKLWI